jgi:hypothetical protein
MAAMPVWAEGLGAYAGLAGRGGGLQTCGVGPDQGRVAIGQLVPGARVSGLEEEFGLPGGLLRLLYVQAAARDREPLGSPVGLRAGPCSQNAPLSPGGHAGM